MKKTALAFALFLSFMATGFSQKIPGDPQFFIVPDADFELVFEIKTYPNPATERVFIETDFVQPVDFQVFSMAGKCVKTGRLDEAGIGVSELDSGIYFLELRASNGRFLTNLLLEKR